MFHVSGVVKGCRKFDQVDRKTGEVTEKWYIGFASPKVNGYDGEEIVQEVQVSKKMFESGLVAHYEKFKGQLVLAPIFPSAYQGKNGIVISYFFTGDGKPKAMPKPAAA